jgi:hypothetical protein
MSTHRLTHDALIHKPTHDTGLSQNCQDVTIMYCKQYQLQRGKTATRRHLRGVNVAQPWQPVQRRNFQAQRLGVSRRVMQHAVCAPCQPLHAACMYCVHVQIGKITCEACAAAGSWNCHFNGLLCSLMMHTCRNSGGVTVEPIR